MAAEPLGPGAVYRRCSFADAPFETTDDLEPLGAPIAHDRAVRALHVATALRGTGSHFFALARELEDARRVTLELLTLDAASAPPAQASESFFFRPARARSSFGWTSRENSSRINFDAGEKAATTK